MRASSLDEIVETYRVHGHRQYGEDVTELEHALQCATFARDAGEPDVVVAAALLHDYGHLCHDLGEDIAERGVDAEHERLGYELLRVVFVDAIADAARLHVAAKRYLCTTEPGYLAQLSPSSVRSLMLQGGPMSPVDAQQFMSEPHAPLAVRVRRYDDMGKVPGMRTDPIDAFAPLLREFVRPSA